MQRFSKAFTNLANITFLKEKVNRRHGLKKIQDSVILLDKKGLQNNKIYLANSIKKLFDHKEIENLNVFLAEVKKS